MQQKTSQAIGRIMQIVVIDDKVIIESHNDLEVEQVIKRLDLIRYENDIVGDIRVCKVLEISH